MSLDLTVLMRERLSEDTLGMLHAFLLKKGFVKERLGSHLYYASIRENISLAIYISRSPMRDEYWKDQYEDGDVLEFRPKATIVLESRHTRASHLKSYSLAKAIATRVGGIIFDPQVFMTYSARGKLLTKTKKDKEWLRYGAPVETYVKVVHTLIRDLQKGNDRKALKKGSGRRPARRRT